MADATSQQRSELSATAGEAQLRLLGPSWAYPPAKGATLKELEGHLQGCLAHLLKMVAAPYRDASSLDNWPSTQALNHLTTLVEATGRAIGIKKIEIGFLDGVIRHINRRYPRLKLGAFIKNLLRKLETVPSAPLKRIDTELANCADAQKKQQLAIIQDLLLNFDRRPKVKPGGWRALQPVLLDLAGGQIKTAIAQAKPRTMQEIDFDQAKAMFGDAIALAVFLELQNEHLAWRLKWGQKLQPAVRWIYMLQNEEWDTRLRRVLILNDPPPELFQKATKREGEKRKKQRYRQKKQGGTNPPA